MAAPTRAALEAWLDGYVRLWNAGDEAAWLENHQKLVSGDVSMEDPVGTRVKRGVEACFREPWQRFNGNTKFSLRDVFICGSEVAFVNDNHWTHDGKTTIGTSIEIYRFEADGSLVIRTWWEVPQDREIMREYVSKRSIADIMQKKVKTIAPDKTLPELERELLRWRIGAMPVVERGGKLVGIVSRSDVVRQLCLERSLGEAMADAYRDQTDAGFAAQSQTAIAGEIGRRMEGLRVRDVMIREVLTVPPDLPVTKAAQLLLERGIHRLPVVENGKLVGIVSSLDFARIVAEASA